jgi:hypothetical protein
MSRTRTGREVRRSPNGTRTWQSVRSTTGSPVSSLRRRTIDCESCMVAVACPPTDEEPAASSAYSSAERASRSRACMYAANRTAASQRGPHLSGGRCPGRRRRAGATRRERSSPHPSGGSRSLCSCENGAGRQRGSRPRGPRGGPYGEPSLWRPSSARDTDPSRRKSVMRQVDRRAPPRAASRSSQARSHRRHSSADRRQCSW